MSTQPRGRRPEASAQTADRLPPSVFLIAGNNFFGRKAKEIFLCLGFDVCLALDLDEAVHTLKTYRPAVVILVVHQAVSESKTLERIANLQRSTNAPIIMLTVTDDLVATARTIETCVESIILHLQSNRMVFAQLRMLLGRHSSALPTAKIREIRPLMSPMLHPYFGGGWIFRQDILALVRLGAAAESLPLTSAESMLLTIMSRAASYPFDRDELTQRVLQRPWRFGDRAIDNIIARLRAKLRRHGASKDTLRSVRGVGYVFVPADVMENPSRTGRPAALPSRART